MPSAAASRGLPISTGSPSNSITPLSTGGMPPMHFTSVDLPAPLSPTRAVTSPACASKFTSRSTWTGPKLLWTAFRDRVGCVVTADTGADTPSRYVAVGGGAGPAAAPVRADGGGTGPGRGQP